MKYFLDTEFRDDGISFGAYDLISIGIVREDGFEFYKESISFDWNNASDWLKLHVKTSLFNEPPYLRILPDIRNDALEFFANDDDIEIWGYFPSYDWVLFCSLFGPMINLPKPLPHRINDLKQLANFKGIKIKQENSIHNALEDARWIKETYFYLINQ